MRLIVLPSFSVQLLAAFVSQTASTKLITGCGTTLPTMAPATFTIPQGSRLLGLPAELRSTLFEHAMDDLDETVVVIGNEGQPLISDVQHSLSRTCRQLRHEFGPYAVEAAGKRDVAKIPFKNF